VNKTIEYIIFDLDGTLIDSSRSIIKSYLWAFSESQIEPVDLIDLKVMGPSLIESLSRLSGTD
jgi:phosphoglycolate phosphatase